MKSTTGDLQAWVSGERNEGVSKLTSSQLSLRVFGVLPHQQQSWTREQQTLIASLHRHQESQSSEKYDKSWFEGLLFNRWWSPSFSVSLNNLAGVSLRQGWTSCHLNPKMPGEGNTTSWAPFRCSAHWWALHSLLMSNSHCVCRSSGYFLWPPPTRPSPSLRPGQLAPVITSPGRHCLLASHWLGPAVDWRIRRDRAGYFFPAPSLLGCHHLGGRFFLNAPLQFQIPLGSSNSFSHPPQA